MHTGWNTSHTTEEKDSGEEIDREGKSGELTKTKWAREVWARAKKKKKKAGEME